MKTVNIDLDGVVYPFHEVMAIYTFQKNGDYDNVDFKYDWDYAESMPYPAPSLWGFMGDWGLTPQQFDSLFRLGVDEGVVWTQGNPIKNSVNSLWELNDAGVYIRIVTHRLVHKNNHAQVQKATADWLDKWNVPYHEIVYVGNGSSKAHFIADYALDDKPQNVMEMNRIAYMDAYLLDRPWNRDFETDQRLYDWRSFVDIVTGVYDEEDDGLPSREMDSDSELSADSPDTSEVGTDN